MKHCVLILLTTLFISCQSGNKDSALIFKNNMDGLHAWVEKHPANIIKTDEAHSGKFACKLFSESPYSTTFYISLSDVDLDNNKKLKVSGWVLSSDKNAKPTLVVDLLDKDKQSFEYIAKDCRENIKEANTWVQITNEIDLSPMKRNSKENFLKVYFLNTETQYVLVDDMIVEFSR